MADEPAGNAYFDDVIDRLMFTPPNRLSDTLSATPIPDAAAFEAAIDARAHELEAAGLARELELLTHVRNAVRAALGDHGTQFSDRDALLDAAVKRRGLLPAFFLLRDHREHVDVALFERMEKRFGEDRVSGDVAAAAALCAIGALVDDPLVKCRTHLLWGGTMREAGRLGRAASHLARAAELAGRHGDAQLRRWVAGASATVAHARGDLATALHALVELVEAADREGDRVDAAAIRPALARVLRDLGRHAAAIAVLDPVLDQLGNRQDEMNLRRLRALMLDELGRYEEGEAEYERAAAIAAAIGDAHARQVLLSDRAWSALKRDDPETAIRRLDELVRFAERETNLSWIAAARNNLAQAYLDAGRLADAEREFSRAWSMRLRQTFDPGGAAISVFGLGDVARERGDVENARSFYRMALMFSLDDEVLIGAALRLAQLDPDDDEALEMLERLLDRSPSAFLAIAVAARYQGRRRHSEATRVLREALAREAAIDAESHAAMQLRAQLGALLGGDPVTRPEAHRLLREVVQGALERVAEARLDDRRSEIVSEWIDAFSDLLELLVADGSPEAIAEAFGVHESAKSRSFAAALAGGALPVPATVPRQLGEREDALHELERELQRGGGEADGGRLARRLSRLDAVQDELEECWSAMAVHAPEYVALRRGDPTTIARLRTLLEPVADRTAFVSFFCASTATTVFVVRSDDAHVQAFETSVRRSEVTAAVAALRRAFNGAPDAYPPVPAILRDRPGERPLTEPEAVAERLLRDVFEAIDGCDLVCLAPHGPLHALPLHALPATGRVLADDHAVVHAPSATTLAYSLAAPSRAPQSIAVAGVAAATDRHPEHFEEDDTIFAAGVTAAPGVAATKDTVRSLLTERDIVHVTCHGYFDARDPLASGLLLSDGKVRPPRHPGSLSVAQRSRFVLTAREILATRTRARLVALRACSTGVHAERQRGDELQGLARALLHAGAGAVAVSLWNVDQRSSKDLFAGFYRSLLATPEPEPAWRSLWLAQRALRANDVEYLRHPYHWAPVVLTGDWR